MQGGAYRGVDAHRLIVLYRATDMRLPSAEEVERFIQNKYFYRFCIEFR